MSTLRIWWPCSGKLNGGCLRDDGTLWLNYGDAYAGFCKDTLEVP